MADWIPLDRAFQLVLSVEQDADLTGRLLISALWHGQVSAVARRAFVDGKPVGELAIPTKATWGSDLENNPVTFDWHASRAKSAWMFYKETRTSTPKAQNSAEYFRIEVFLPDLHKLSPELNADCDGVGGNPNLRSGAPGRPTSMHLVICEFERRYEAGERHGPIKVWSAVLLDWLKTNHPGMPRPTAKTIGNNLGPHLRTAKMSQATRNKIIE